tara:strand:- start:44 stop:241 length:198 start_codon:yes stop_codon:yes gene_type:complete
MTKEKCERAVKALEKEGFNASYAQGAPDDHGVWIESVWNVQLKQACEFRIHNEEIEYWQSYAPTT